MKRERFEQRLFRIFAQAGYSPIRILTITPEEMVEISEVEPVDPEFTFQDIPVWQLGLFGGGLVVAIGILIVLAILKKRRSNDPDEDDDDYYTWMDLSTNNQDTVGTILALGFQWNSPSNWAVPSDNSDKWIVTQVLIWEAIANHAFKQGSGLYGVESGVDADMQMISTHAYNPTKFSIWTTIYQLTARTILTTIYFRDLGITYIDDNTYYAL